MDNRQDEFDMRELTLDDVKEYNELLRYAFQVTNQELLESGYEEGELLKSKQPILEHATVFGWFDEGELVSQIAIYPCQVNIHGKIYEMGGVTGVGTYPEYANLGLMSALITKSLNHMREKKQWISYLYPYSIPFYRRKGWEIINDHIEFTIKDTQMPQVVEVTGYVERLEVDDIDVMKIYNEFSHKNHGAMIRDDFMWEEYWRWENEDERIAAVYYNEAGEPKGYIFYYLENDIFYVKDMIYLQQEARNGLWNFISAHFSMIDEVKGNIYKNEPMAFLLDDSQIEEQIQPYFMGRVVDVEAFLREYPFVKPGDRPIYFDVTDPLAPWNNRIFSLEWINNKLQITDKPIGAGIQIDIQTFTSLFMSYRGPGYFYHIERLGTNAETIQLLEEILPNQQPFFSDYF